MADIRGPPSSSTSSGATLGAVRIEVSLKSLLSVAFNVVSPAVEFVVSPAVEFVVSPPVKFVVSPAVEFVISPPETSGVVSPLVTFVIASSSSSCVAGAVSLAKCFLSECRGTRRDDRKIRILKRRARGENKGTHDGRISWQNTAP